MNTFFSSFAINMVLQMVKSMMDNGLADHVMDLVYAAFDTDVSGVEKKAAVMAELDDIGGVVGVALADTAPWLLNLLIEALVGKYKIDNA